MEEDDSTLPFHTYYRVRRTQRRLLRLFDINRLVVETVLEEMGEFSCSSRRCV